MTPEELSAWLAHVRRSHYADLTDTDFGRMHTMLQLQTLIHVSEITAWAEREGFDLVQIGGEE